MEIIFFAGKGGVGKSTNSSLYAYKKAVSGKKVLLNSIDPAHNLHDIFEQKLKNKPVELIPGLKVMETNLDKWVKIYLKDTEDAFKSVYKYQEAFNLHKYFKTLRYSPGLEEYAVLLSIKDTIKKYKDQDLIIFDTPPTALTMKFLALPQVNLLWLKELKKFREMILQKKEIIIKINSGHKDNGKVSDKILAKLDLMIQENDELNTLLQDRKKCSVKLVMNHDKLSLAESEDIIVELGNLGIGLSQVIINKCSDSDAFREELAGLLNDNGFAGAKVIYTPSYCQEMTGLEALEEFVVTEGYLD